MPVISPVPNRSQIFLEVCEELRLIHPKRHRDSLSEQASLRLDYQKRKILAQGIEERFGFLAIPERIEFWKTILDVVISVERNYVMRVKAGEFRESQANFVKARRDGSLAQSGGRGYFYPP